MKKTHRKNRNHHSLRRLHSTRKAHRGRFLHVEGLEDRRMLAYDVSLDGGILMISEANLGDNGALDVSQAGGTYTIADTNGITFNAATGGGAAAITNNGTSIQVSIANVNEIDIDMGTGDDALTTNTEDVVATSPYFTFAGFSFNQDFTPDQAVLLPAGPLVGGQGVNIDSGHDGPTGSAAFPLDNTGFDDSLSVGRLLGLGGSGTLAVNLPTGNNGTLVRSGIEFSWSGAQTLTNVSGNDFVVYSSSSSPTAPDGFMVQVHEAGGGWSSWLYEPADARENYVGAPTEGAFVTAFDISDLGLSDGDTIDRFRMVNLKSSDRIEGPGVETSPGSGALVGTGIVIPDDGGATSDVFPDPGPLASFDFFGNSTLDPDPLYIGVLHPLGSAETFNVDEVAIDANSINITSGGIVQDPINYANVDTLNVNTQSGDDTFEVELGGLPAAVNLDGGDPSASDVVTVDGTAGTDNITLQDDNLTDGSSTIAFADIEQLVVDVSADGLADSVEVNRSFTLNGNSSSVDVVGTIAEGDELIVNAEQLSGGGGAAEEYSYATVTFDETGTPNQFAAIAPGVIDGGAIVTSTPNTRTSSITQFPDDPTPATFDKTLSLGFLIGGTVGPYALNLPRGNDGTAARSGIVLSWDLGRTLTNFGGQDDFVVYESASSSTGVEAFMLQVHDPNAGTWSPWIYQPASFYEPYAGSGTGEGATATLFNLDDFGIANGTVIDEIRIVNMTNADRMVNASGVGEVIPEDNGATSTFLPERGVLNPGLGYAGGALDPDPLYLGVLHALGAPAGSSDRVVIDPTHVQTDGHLPINYTNLADVTVNTGGSSDTILATPSTTTQYFLNGGDPDISNNPGDALTLDLTGVSVPTFTITGESAGTLSSTSHADVNVTGIDFVDAEPPFALVGDDAANDNGGADNDFLLQRNGSATEVTVNGQLVFRGDSEAINDITINGSADDDTLTVDFGTGNPVPPGGVAFNGSTGTDDMVLNNGTFNTITHTFTASTPTWGGTVDIDGSLITYTGLEPIFDNLSATNRIFTFDTGAADVIVIDDDTTDTTRSRIASDNSETVLFKNPSQTMIVNAGVGGDTINFQQVDDDYDAETTLNGDAGNDTIRIDSNGPAAGGSVDFVTFPVTVNGGGDGGDDLMIEDSSDTTGDLFSITSTQVGADGITAGSAVNSAIDPSPIVDGVVGPTEWNFTELAFDSGPRLGPDQQTVLHFPFDEGSGIVANDSSENHNDGVLIPVAGPKLRPLDGVFGGALEFDGVDDFAWFQDTIFDVGNAGTVSFWVNMDDQGRRNQFFEGPGNSGFEVQFRTNGGGQFYGSPNRGAPGNSDDYAIQNGPAGGTSGTWINIQSTWDFGAKEMRLYIDGAEVTYLAGFDQNIANWVSIVDTIDGFMNVGRDPGDPSRQFDGLMDDIAWFNTTLDQTQRDEIRTVGMGTAQTNLGGALNALGSGGNLVAHWNLDDPIGTTALSGDAGTTVVLHTTAPPPGPTFQPGAGQFGGALEFDGIDDFAYFQDASFNVGAAGTLNFWVNMDDQVRRNQFFEGPGNAGFEFQYRTNSGGQFFGTPNSGSDYAIQSGSAGGTTGVWTNLQYTWDFATKEMRIYRDGSEVSYLGGFDQNIGSWTSIVNTISGVMNVGQDPGDVSRFFDGLMDDVAWFDAVLSPAQRNEIRTVGVTQAQTNLGSALNPIGGGGNLAAHWNLDDAVGTLVAPGNSGTSIDLIIVQAPEGAEFNPGGGPTLPGSGTTLDSVDFDGDEDFIQVPDSASLDFNKQQGTIALWVKPRFNDIDDNISTGSATLLEDTTEQVELAISWRANSGLGDLYRRVFFYPNEDPGGNDLIVSNSRLPFDTWTHVAVTWDIGGAGTKIYINGQDDGFLLDNTGGITAAGNTGDWIFGGDAGFALDRWFDGEMADPTILNTSLSAGEINDLYQDGVQSTGQFDLSGATGQFAWDDTTL